VTTAGSDPLPPEALEELRREDCTAVYNVMKMAGLVLPDAYSGPELRCLFPSLPLPIIGYAVTSEWTAGEEAATNADFLAYIEHIEAMPGPKIAVAVDIGARPGRGGIMGDGILKEYVTFGCVGAVVGGSVIDIIGIERLRVPVYATGVVPAYDQLRMTAFARPVSVGPLRIADGDLVMADQGGVIRIPRGAVPEILAGMAAFRTLERSVAELLDRPGLTAADLRRWYAENEPEFLGDEAAETRG
jgi:regulator of RNase E activity RraA